MEKSPPHVTLAAEALLSLQAAALPPPPSWTLTLVSNTIRATTRPGFVDYEFTFAVQVNSTAQDALAPWLMLPLVSDQLTVSSCTVEGAEGHLVVVNNAHTLLVRSTGVALQVSIAAQGQLAGKSKTAFSLWLPRAGATFLTLTVTGRENVHVTAEPSFGGVLASSASNTVFTAAVPNSDQLSVRWTDAGDSDTPVVASDAAKEKDAGAGAGAVKTDAAPVPLSITVEQAHLFSVGEGMLLISSDFKYDVRNGSVSTLAFVVDPRLRVLSVDGQHLARWEAVGAAGAAGAASDASAADAVIQVALNQAVDGIYRLQVESEIELGGTTANFRCPSFAHVGAPISRELGFIAVEARTNVEVDQAALPSGCVPIDIGELSDTLRGSANHPILLGYKFLQPHYDLQLSVQRHGDVSVCVALVESAAFTMTLTEQGQLMKRLVLMVRNSSRQYVRVFLPTTEHEIWSTVVNNKAVKPATDGSALMIPLKHEGGRQGLFPVELVWVDAPQPGLGVRGDVGFTLPRIDLPINKLFVEAWLPAEYKYGEFSGDLRECQSFSATPPTGEEATPDVPHTMAMSFDRHRADSVILQSLALNLDDNDESERVGGRREKEMLRAEPQMKAKRAAAPMQMRAMASSSPPPPQQMFGGGGAAGRGRAGVVPVRVAMVKSGRRFLFERLLLLPEEPALTVTVDYKRKSDSEIRAHA